MKSYVFKVELIEEDDGRWSAIIPTLPGCATWGYTADEAMEAMREAAQAFVEVLLEDGRLDRVEKASSVVEGAAIAVVAKLPASVE